MGSVPPFDVSFSRRQTISAMRQDDTRRLTEERVSVQSCPRLTRQRTVCSGDRRSARTGGGKARIGRRRGVGNEEMSHATKDGREILTGGQEQAEVSPIVEVRLRARQDRGRN